MGNRLAGSGPQPGGNNNDGPSPSLTGTLGVAPQAAPQQGAMPPQNMLSRGGGAQQNAQGPGGAPGGPPAPIVPPSKATLMEVSHKQNLIIAYLRELLSKPDLKTKDILTAAGEIVADRVMTPFDAARWLADLPGGDASPLQLRQWVAQHFATSSKNMGIVHSMIAAHGAMVRRQAAGMPMPAAPMGAQQGPAAPPQMPPATPAPANQLSAMR
jgi:hypothetical protein